jgi:hypothetical protein
VCDPKVLIKFVRSNVASEDDVKKALTKLSTSSAKIIENMESQHQELRPTTNHRDKQHSRKHDHHQDHHHGKHKDNYQQKTASTAQGNGIHKMEKKNKRVEHNQRNVDLVIGKINPAKASPIESAIDKVMNPDPVEKLLSEAAADKAL